MGRPDLKDQLKGLAKALIKDPAPEERTPPPPHPPAVPECDLPECDLRDKNGRCRKFGEKSICARSVSTPEWFEDKLNECEIKRVCRLGSIFGNSFYIITDEQLEALKAGKVLFDVGEYGTFLMLESAIPERGGADPMRPKADKKKKGVIK